MDADLIKVVAEDLEFLSKQWDQDIDEASLRRASPILRSLLVEHKLRIVGEYFNINMRIMAPEDRGATLKSQGYTFWQAAGAKNRGMEVHEGGMRNRALTEDEIRADIASMDKAHGKSHPVKIGAFLGQISFIVEGVCISREEVIKYVANKLGGVHYNNERKANAKPETSLDDKYVSLDLVRAQWHLMGKNAIYFELLSIGQLLINSRDVQNLRKKLAPYR